VSGGKCCIWHAVCDVLTWHDMCVSRGVWTTWRRRATEGIIRSVHERGLGVRYMRQAKQTEHLGSSRGLTDRRWSSMYEHSSQQSRSYVSVDSGLGWLQRVTSGRFPSVLRWSWRFLNVKKLLSSTSEVLIGSPGVSRVNWRFCLRHLGGSKRRSCIMMADIRFGAEQITFKRKTAIMGCLVILDWFTFKLLGLERDFAAGKCWFQKSGPRGGYRAYSWTKLRSGAL